MSTLIQPESVSLIRQHFLKSMGSFDAHSAVFEAISDRMMNRLELLAIEPKRVLDLGCRTGYQLQSLAQRYPDATVIGVDPAPGRPAQLPRSWPKWLRRPQRGGIDLVACDPHELPFASGSVDLVVSNLLLPWCHAPHRVFEEVCRILSPDGAFMFASAGPDTLIEYRHAWSDIDRYLHSFGLIDMHDLGDSMMSAGFAAPVLDRDNLIIDYPDIRALQDELRFLGAQNVARGRRMGLMSPGVSQQLAANLGKAGRFPVTLELVQGHGWKGALGARPDASGDITIAVDSLKGSWSNKAGRKR